MEHQQITQMILTTSQRINKATTVLHKQAKEKANAEFEYRQALAKEITTLKANGMQTTLIPDVARGNVADLKLKRDLADGIYRSSIESLKALQNELSGLQSILRIQSEV